jgi:hypothetical protein
MSQIIPPSNGARQHFIFQNHSICDNLIDDGFGFMLLSAIQDLVTVDAGQNHLAQLIRFQVATAFGVSKP